MEQSVLGSYCVHASHKLIDQLQQKTCTAGPQIRVCNEKLFSYFSTKTYVVGTQKNRLNETVLLRTQNTCLNRWIRKKSQFYAENLCLTAPMAPTFSAALSAGS